MKSIRYDFIDVIPWVEAILDLDIDTAHSLYQDMLKKGFDCWPFRDKENLFKAVQYIQNEHPGDQTGLVVSSHMKKKVKEYFGKQYKSSYVKFDDAYHWYTKLGPKLTYGASEFLIQGIELEYPIVAFVGDYYIKDEKWVIDKDAVFDPAIKDKESIIKNVYRVLLTRSRKGMFIYFPMDTKFDETFNWFKKCITL